MADTPPKPKPGSLRDRIAAFEKDAAAASSVPKPPPPRPKPGHVSWKPAPPSPSAATGSVNDDKQHHMSANDAKESIGAGGSLKERMAALRGKVAFGGMGISAPPPVPKPLKRPPLVVPASSPDDEHEERPKQLNNEKISEEHVNSTLDKEESPILDENDNKEAAPEQEDQDEEAKERERRAALAARMARLGGARIGMAPPVIARKPERRQVTDPSEEKAAETPTTSHTSPPEGVAADVAPQPDEAEVSSEPQPIILTHESIVSPSDSDTTPHKVLPQPSFSSSHSSSPSIPLPAIPKRPHGPPRHKGSSRSSQSDPKPEETATEAISERSVQDTIDISSAVESNVHEQTSVTEELQSNSPEATIDTQSAEHPADTHTEQDTKLEHEFDAHTGGVDGSSVSSPQADSEAEAEAEAEIATPETTTAVDTDAPETTVIVEHSSSDEHKRLVVSMPENIDHDGSDTANTVTKYLEHAENMEDTEEAEEDTKVVVEDELKLM